MSTVTDLTTLKINLLTEAQYNEAKQQGTINANELYLTPASGSSGGGTVTSVRVQATSPVQSSTSTEQTTSLNTTISLADGYGDTKNPYGTKSANQVLAGPSSGSAAAPSFRALVASDIPDLSSVYLTLANLPIASANSLGGIKVGTGLTIDAQTGVLNATGTSITIDSALSNTSTNPVQNKVINSALSSKIETETDPVFSASAASGITSSDITNWNGKTSNTGTVTSVRVQATSPVNSSTSTEQTATLNTTISLSDAYGDTKNPYGTKTAGYVLAGPTSGSAAAPSFRALAASDIPDLSGTYLTSETDPIYSASAASGITSSDISSWNGKASTDTATSSANGLMSSTDKAKLDGMSSGSVWYGTSSTTASTAEKAVTCADFDYKTGSIIAVLFTTANTAATPTLNVNSKGAKSILIGTASANATNNVLKWSANTILLFIYSGYEFRYLTAVASSTAIPPRGANTWYGSCSTTASTAAKTSTIDNFVLTKGSFVILQTTTANTVSNAAITLNVNSTGAATVYYGNATTSSTNKLPWNAYDVLTFMYDGTYWRYVSGSTGISPSITETDPVFTASAAYGISSSDITNWNGKTSNTGTVTSVRVQATSPVNSSTSTAQSTSLNTTISLADAYGDTKNPYGTKTQNYVLAGPTTGSAAAPTFRALVAADIPPLSYASTSTATSSANGLMSSTDKSKLDGMSEGSVWYGTCSTTASTAAKTSAVTNFALKQGSIVALQMTTANTVTSSALTLNVNSTGAKTIYVDNAATSSSNTLPWEANDVLTFMYDGTYWRLVCWDRRVYIAQEQNASHLRVQIKDGNSSSDVVTSYIDLPEATTSYPGILSSSDKTKLDSVTSGAQPNPVWTDVTSEFLTADNTWNSISTDFGAYKNGTIIELYAEGVTTSSGTTITVPSGYASNSYVFAICGQSSSTDNTFLEIVSIRGTSILIPEVSGGNFTLMYGY